MRPIKNILDSLGAEQRAVIMLAFNTGIQQHIEYAPGKFVGVNILKPGANMIIEQTVGHWSAGTLKGKEKDD